MSEITTYTHSNKMHTYDKIPQEIWDEITSYLPPLLALYAAEMFNFQPRAYDKVWSAIFKSDQWHESCGAEYANIVLVGTDLDILSGTRTNSARPSLVLTAFDRAGDLQYEDDLLRSSFRGTYTGPGEYHLEQTVLTIGSFDVPEVFGKDFRYLFSRDGQQLQTKYCYWKDPSKKIRTLKGQDIRGIGGQITEVNDLDPIFLLNLHPPVQCIPAYFPLRLNSTVTPEQYIFRSFGGSSFWTGHPYLVEPIYGDRTGSGEYVFNGFTFKDKKYEGEHKYNPLVAYTTQL